MTNKRFEQFVRDTSYRSTAEQKDKAFALTSAGKWEEVNGAHWQKPEGGDTVFDSNRQEHPVVEVSWEDAQSYCRWAAKRLPTEAEFEYATRAGTETKYWWGQSHPGSRLVANIDQDDDGYVRTAPVGSFDANPFGLYDMTGNVAEWTADGYYHEYYANSPLTNPSGPSGVTIRVIRGGSWGDGWYQTRSAHRFFGFQDFAIAANGFRCAQDVPK